MKVTEITFRMAKASDAYMLLKWRNDEENRKQHPDGEKVPDGEHLDWMSKIITSKDNILLIAEMGGKPVGAFRMDKFTTGGGFEVPDVRLISYTVAPELRRRGLGRAIVAEGCVCYGQEYGLMAKIRDSNIASKKILEACDFVFMGESETGISVYIRPTSKEDTIQ